MPSSGMNGHVRLERFARRTLAVLAVLVAVSVFVGLLPGHAAAQGDGAVAEFFGWLTSTPPDWNRGILYAVLGVVGALVILFTLIGGAIPGTAGKAKIDEGEETLKDWTDQLTREMKKAPPDPAAIEKKNRAVDDLRDDLWKERWKQFSLAAIFYTVLGSFFATMFAQDLLQALLIGAGWTGIAGSLGLKGDFAYRKSRKDDLLEEVHDALQALTPAAAITGASAPPEEIEKANHLDARIQMVRAL